MSSGSSMVQSWREVLFLHWPVEASALRPLIPKALQVDTFDGTAWIGIVPFRMQGVRLRALPPMPGASAFPELNVRTYVRHEGRAGVWFFSLDASSFVAVAAARAWFGLPYFYARMSSQRNGDEVTYRSQRRPDGAWFKGRYRPIGEPATAAEGTHEHWLVERYCLFAQKRRRVFIGEIEHAPWALQDAEAEFECDALSPVELPGREPLRHYSAGVDVAAWSPRAIA